jgi:hypothetical protein
MARNKNAAVKLIGNKLPMAKMPGDILGQPPSPLLLSQADKGSYALVDMQGPVHEPEVTKKKPKTRRAKTIIAKKVAAKPSSKTKSKLPARPAKKPEKKSLAKRTRPAQSVTNATNIQTLVAENNLTASHSVDVKLPWKDDIITASVGKLRPLERNASLQIYGRSNWFGNARDWIRLNVSNLFKHRQKTVPVMRPSPKKLGPREMIKELNRLSEENRQLRAKLDELQRNV